MDNNSRIGRLRIECCHENGMSYCDGASVTLNVHSALTANTARILETPVCLFLVSGIILKLHADLLKFCHSCTLFPQICRKICYAITKTYRSCCLSTFANRRCHSDDSGEVFGRDFSNPSAYIRHTQNRITPKSISALRLHGLATVHLGHW